MRTIRVYRLEALRQSDSRTTTLNRLDIAHSLITYKTTWEPIIMRIWRRIRWATTSSYPPATAAKYVQTPVSQRRRCLHTVARAYIFKMTHKQWPRSLLRAQVQAKFTFHTGDTSPRACNLSDRYPRGDSMKPAKVSGRIFPSLSIQHILC